MGLSLHLLLLILFAMGLLSRFLGRFNVKRAVRWSGLFVAGVLVSGTSCFFAGQSAEAVMPSAADQFVDSVGINVRMSYFDWPTATNWDHPDPQQNIRNLLVNLGVRHLRDRIPSPEVQANISAVNPRLAALYKQHGMRFIVGPDRREEGVLDESIIEPMVDWYATGEIDIAGGSIAVRDMVEGFEGPNEYDQHHKQDQRERNWASNLHAFQTKLYEAVKAKPQLADLPVIAPALIHTAYCGNPLQSFEAVSDLGNLHPYPNYPYMRHPTATLDWHLSRVGGCSGQQPIWATETGYFSHAADASEISETTTAKYTPRLLTEYFLTDRIQRTYLHEIARAAVDGWGLIAAEADGSTSGEPSSFKLRPKPAYYAVSSLLNLLSEATWTVAEEQWQAPAVNLKPVNLSFTEKAPTTHHLLLQKSSGHYFLLLWQEVESYNPDRGNFEVEPDRLTVNLPATYRPLAVYRYNSEFAYDRAAPPADSSAVTLDVPDSVLVLEFS